MWSILYVKYFTKVSLQDSIYEYILSKLNADQSSILPWGLSLTFISRALCCMFIITCPHKCVIDPPTHPTTPAPRDLCVSRNHVIVLVCPLRAMLNMSFYVCPSILFPLFMRLLHIVSAAAMWSLVRPCVAVVPSSSQLQIEGSRPLLLRAPPFQSAHHSEAEQALWLSPVCHRRWSRQAAILWGRQGINQWGGGEEGKEGGEGEASALKPSYHLTSVSIDGEHSSCSYPSVTEFSNTKVPWVYFYAKSRPEVPLT